MCEVGVVWAQGALGAEEPAHGVEGVFLGVGLEEVDFDEVAEGFGHFLSFGDPVGVGVDGLGWFFSECVEHGGPDDGVEPEDVFGHEVGDLALPIFLAFGVIDGGEVVAEGLDPDIDSVGVVAWHFDAPVGVVWFDFSADGDWAEALFEPAKDFVFAGFGEDLEVAGFDLFFEPGFVSWEVEEPVLFDSFFEWFAGDG